MVSNDRDFLLKIAQNVRKNAHTPYSHFPVGASLLTADGHIYTGCNVENAAYSVTCCAERIAIFKAVSEGQTHFNQMPVVADTKRPISPCGACRQVMAEFFTKNTTIYLGNLNYELLAVTMADLLPSAFKSDDLSI